MTKKRVVVHYISGAYLGSDWIYSEIKNLRKFEPIVYCFGTKNLSLFPVDKLRSFWPNQTNFFPYILIKKHNPLLLYWLFRDKPALIHAHFGPSGYDFLHWKMILNVPLITSFYGADISSLPKKSFLWRQRYKILFSWGERFLAMGLCMKKKLVGLGCPEEKIIVLPLGINFSEIKYQPRKLKPKERVKILAAGRFVEKKGFSDVIEALFILKRSHPEIQFQLSIVGGANSSPEQQNEKKIILDKINKFHLDSDISILGMMNYPDFIEELYKHHIFLSPSVTAKNGDDEGGYNMTILEASASGMPVISTLHCDIPDTIVDGKTGYLVPEHRPDLIAEKLKILINNPQAWPEIGKNGRELIRKEYDVQKLIPKLENIYDQYNQDFS